MEIERKWMVTGWPAGLPMTEDYQMDQGYVSGPSLSGPMPLTPVWQVTTDTGFYQLDLVTGGVSRLS